MRFVYLDFETRSVVDIKKQGAAIYCADPSTDILCVAFTEGENVPALVYNSDLQDFHSRNPFDDWATEELYRLASDADVVFVAHNAYFERHVWQDIMVARYGFPAIPKTRWKCTLAKAQAAGLPGKLELAARILNLGAQKDMKGNAAMLFLCKPKKKGSTEFWEPWEQPEKFQELYDYCVQDVITERQLDKALPNLIPSEKKVWEIDQRVNDEGIYLDRKLISRAIEIGTEHKLRIKREFGTVTGDTFSPRQRARFRQWLLENGVIVPDTKKTTLEKIQSTDFFVTEAIRLVAEANKSSLAKYPAMILKSDCDGRARELLAYHAAHTGRWGGRGIQIHNMTHTKFPMDTLCQSLEVFDYDFFSSCYPDVPTALSSGGRGMIIPGPGYEFLVADYKSIEHIALAWSAGQLDVVESFIRLEDPYKVAAMPIYDVAYDDVTKEQRSVGKVSDLSLGYEGGIAAAIKMSVAYKVDLAPVINPLMATATKEEWLACDTSYGHYLRKCDEINRDPRKKQKIEPAPKMLAYVADLIKQRWRAKNEKIVQFWRETQAAAIEAVRTKQVVDCGFYTWFVHKQFLRCRLPTGRDICYPFPQVEELRGGRFKLSYMSLNSTTHQWEREDTYGGKLVENLIQGLCRDIMTDAMLRMEETIYKTRFSVHDELIAMVLKGKATKTPEEKDLQLEEFLDFLREPIMYLPGLPIMAEGKRLQRYEKI